LMPRLGTLISIAVLSIVIASIAAIATPVAAQGGYQPVHKIVYIAFSDDTKGLLALKKGTIDVYVPHKPISPSQLQALGLSTEKVRVVTASGGICVMLLNIIADKGPLGRLGIVTDPMGHKHFNPFAIRKIRFAFNLMINREYIAEHIVGLAYPAFVVLSPTLPYYDEIYKVIRSMGFTPTGNLTYAKKIIDQTLENISKQLAKYGYKLYKKNGFWYFQAPGQKPTCVTIKIVTWKGYVFHEDAMRYVAKELEKVGFCAKVIAVSNAWAYRQSKDWRYMHWNIYTFRRVISEDLLPIWFIDGMYWTYSSAALPAEARNYLKAIHDKLQAEIDALMKKLIAARNFTQLLNIEKKLVKLVLEQSICIAYVNPLRTILVSKNVKDAVIGWASMIYNPWFFRTAKTPTGVLRIGFYSSEMNLVRTINPTIAMNWLSTARILMPVVDVAMFPNPFKGVLAPLRVYWSVKPSTLPATALYFDPTTHSWITVAQAEAKGLLNASKISKQHIVKIVYNYILGPWQSGAPMKLFDILLWLAWNLDWAKHSGPNDKWYFANIWQHPVAGAPQALQCIYGIEIINKTALALYTSPECVGEYNPNLLAEMFVGMVNFWGPRTLWPWFPPALMMATGYLLIYGGPVTHKHYILAGHVSPTTARIDYGNPNCVKDLVAALKIIAEGKYLPPYAKATIELAKKFPVIGSPDIEQEAKSLIAFAQKYGHLIVSQGAFIITEYKPDKIVFTKFSQYPRSPQSFYEELKSYTITVSGLQPLTVVAGKPLTIRLSVSEKIVYPEELAGVKPAESAYIVGLIVSSGKIVARELGHKVAPGVWEITFPAAVTANLKPGTYTVKILYAVSPAAPLKEVETSLTVLPPPTPTKTTTVVRTLTHTVTATKTSVAVVTSSKPTTVTKHVVVTITKTSKVPSVSKVVTTVTVTKSTVKTVTVPTTITVTHRVSATPYWAIGALVAGIIIAIIGIVVGAVIARRR